ncbi:MAG: peptidoglycan-associated lipoprotein Pal [candidate division Zixibacteria bacterium]|nr:peptidoglycan-associated lipoprotein Pal [candidate division Zixibacteria bacterium]
MRSVLVILLGVFILAFCWGCKQGTKIKPAVEQPAPKEEPKAEEQPAPPVEEKKVTETVEIKLEPIYFDFDKYFIRQDAKENLNRNAQLLKDNPQVKIRIEGNCDERGTVEYNLALGEKRARSSMDYLVNLGIEPSRISTISYGKEKPLYPGSNEEDWSKNRRDDFVIVSK